MTSPNTLSEAMITTSEAADTASADALTVADEPKVGELGNDWKQQPADIISPSLKPERLRSGEMMMGAARTRAEASLVRGDPLSRPRMARADAWEAKAREPLERAEAEFGAGGELLPENAFGVSREMRNTLDNPDYVAADASRDRLQLAYDAGVLELGMDTADTIQAGNSIEKMLAHQLASAHHSFMHLSSQLNAAVERMQYTAHEEARERAKIQATRLAGAAARMMTAYQSGALTMQRLKTGGRQQMTVQHLYVTKVEEGGQAVVAGEVGNSRKAARKRKGLGSPHA